MSKSNKASKAKARQARVTSDPAYIAGKKVGAADKSAGTAQAAAVDFLKSAAIDGIVPKSAGIQFRLGYIVGRAGVAVADRDPSDAERKRYDSAARMLLSRARKALDNTPEPIKTEKDKRGGSRTPRAGGKASKSPSKSASPTETLEYLESLIAKHTASKSHKSDAAACVAGLRTFFGI